jgi:hypothetical protein
MSDRQGSEFTREDEAPVGGRDSDSVPRPGSVPQPGRPRISDANSHIRRGRGSDSRDGGGDKLGIDFDTVLRLETLKRQPNSPAERAAARTGTPSVSRLADLEGFAAVLGSDLWRSLAAASRGELPGEPERQSPPGGWGDGRPEQNSGAERRRGLPTVSSEQEEVPQSEEELPLDDDVTRILLDQKRSQFHGPTSFGGNAAARDLYEVHISADRRSAAPTPRIGPIQEENLKHILEVYVRSADYDQTEWQLRQRRVIVLLGPESSGKRSTAIYLLRSVSSQRPIGLEDNVGVVELQRALQPDCGYLVRLDGPDYVKRLDAVSIAEIADTLKQKNAYLIFTVDAQEKVKELDEGYVVQCANPPAEEVFRRHVAWRLHDCEPTHADEWLAWPGVAKELRKEPSPSQVSDLVSYLAHHEGTGEPSSTAVSRWHHDRARRDARELLGEHPTDKNAAAGLQRRAFLVSLAVLNGLSYSRVATMADALATMFHKFENELESRTRTRSIFNYPRDHWLRLAKAEISANAGPASGEGPAGQAITFKNPEMAEALLSELWEEYASARLPTLDWLKQLAQDNDTAVRLYAAYAVGLFSTYDFDQAYHHVISGWAASGVLRQQQAAAWALETAVSNGRLVRRVRNFLYDWCRSTSARRQHTAVLAYGTLIGARFPGDALKNLRYFAGTSGHATIVSRSIVDLFEAECKRHTRDPGCGEPAATDLVSAATEPGNGHGPAVLPTLAEWACAADPRLRVQAAQCFIRLTGHRSPGVAQGCPTLLTMAVEDDQRADLISDLWAVALQEKNTAASAWNALRDWVTAANADELKAKFMCELSNRLFHTPKMREKAAFYIRRWLRDGANSSGVAHTILLMMSVN